MPQQHQGFASLWRRHDVPRRVELHPAALLQVDGVARLGIDQHKHPLTDTWLRLLGCCLRAAALLPLRLLLLRRVLGGRRALADRAAALDEVGLPGLADHLQLQRTWQSTQQQPYV